MNKLYGDIIIPRAVYNELTRTKFDVSKPIEVEKVSWINVRPVTQRHLVKALTLEVHEGEAEAIALAIEIKANLLLIDERKGRNVAKRFNLNSVGLLGVLVEAHSLGYITQVKPILDDLRFKAGFWMSQKLYNKILDIVGE